MQTMWVFNTKKFQLRWEIEEEAPWISIYDLKDQERIEKKIRLGEYVCFLSRMTLTHKRTGRVLGETHLSNSIFDDPTKFHMDSGYFRDKVRECIQQAREQLVVKKTLKLRRAA